MTLNTTMRRDNAPAKHREVIAVLAFLILTIAFPNLAWAKDKAATAEQTSVTQVSSGMERSIKFNVTNKSNRGFPTIARLDALVTVCEGRDPSFRQSVESMWEPKSRQRAFAEKFLGEFLAEYDEAYAENLTLFESNPELFCSEEARADYRRDAGWWLQDSGDANFDAMVAETFEYTQTLDDVSWKQLRSCKARDLRSMMVNCWCQAEKMNEARANGDTRNPSAIAYELASECPGVRWKTYTYQYDRCESANAAGRGFDCKCQASKFADLFAKNPTDQTNYLSSLASQAIKECN